jgi:predicted nucleic acid-binding protein
VKFFFDTSVLLPAFLEDHEHHESSLKVFLGADRRTGCCAAHSLAELYATVTRLPGRHRLSGEQALLFLQDTYERLSVITLSTQEYYLVLKSAAAVGIVGGTIYDALLARCALKADATTIYTWNIRHFQQLGPEIAQRLKTP